MTVCSDLERSETYSIFRQLNCAAGELRSWDSPEAATNVNATNMR